MSFMSGDVCNSSFLFFVWMDVCDLKITCVNGQSIRWMSEETQVWTMLLLDRIVAAAYLWS